MPQFSSGESKIAKVTMRNPSSKAFDYDGVLYMGTNQAVMAEVPFRLNAGESKDVPFSVTMPSAVGKYPVYVGVFSGGVSVALYKAVEDVVIVMPTPFTFTNVTVQQVGMESAPAWSTMIFRCTITNPGSKVSTERLKVMWRFRQYRPTYGEWSSWYQSQLGSFDLPLNPGASHNFVWDGNEEVAPGTVRGPNIGANTQHCMWLEDEWGNKSAEGCVTRGY